MSGRSARTTRRPLGLRLLVLLVVSALGLAACGSSGPDLEAAMGDVGVVGDATTNTALGLDGVSDRAWPATGTPTEVADAIAAVEKPDERTDDTAGDVFLLYKSGTLWVTDVADGDSGVVYYADNDTAYNRHSAILIRNTRWGSQINTYRSSSSSGIGGFFRGGGSGSGK